MAVTVDSTVSRGAFVGGHVGVIVFHFLIALLLFWSQQRSRFGRLTSKQVVYILASLLLVISILAIIPIAMQKSYLVECC